MTWKPGVEGHELYVLESAESSSCAYCTAIAEHTLCRLIDIERLKVSVLSKQALQHPSFQQEKNIPQNLFRSIGLLAWHDLLLLSLGSDVAHFP